jgi:hypothetical protein
MATSRTQIANLALIHLGVDTAISNLSDESSKNANVLRILFDQVFEETLSDQAWPFAKKVEALGLVTQAEDDDHPTDKWGYSYRYPADCVKFNRIQNGLATDTLDSRVAFEIGKDATGRLIWTNQTDAVGEFTMRVTDVQHLPANFVMAFSLKLAFYAAPAITNGDPMGLGARAMGAYDKLMGSAVAHALNEQKPNETDSEMLRVR